MFMLRAYEGSEPYIFISYSHKNKDVVLPVIEALQNSGYNVWFDIGIEAGSEWPEYIATHLRNCACVLTFISNDFVRSHNCRRELLFAQHHEKQLLNIYIEEVELSEGMQMQLCLNQALWKKNFPTVEEFHDAVIRARIIQDCKAKPKTVEAAPVIEKPVVAEPVKTEPQPVKVPEKKVEKKAAPAAKPAPVKTEAKPAAKPKTKEWGDSMPLIGWIVCLLELSYCVASPMLTNAMTGSGVGGWTVFLVLAALHLGIALVNFFVLRFPSKKMKESSYSNYAFVLLALCAVTGVVAMIAGCFNIAYEINVFLKILLSIGLQIVPLACSAILYFALLGMGPKR